MAAAVDEERRRARDVAEVGGVDVLGDAAGSGVLAQVVGEPVGVEPELARVADQVAAPVSASWCSNSRSCISQNLPWLRGGLGRLGGVLGVRVDVGQRQVPPDVAEVAGVGEKFPDRRSLPGRSRGTRGRRTRRG